MSLIQEFLKSFRTDDSLEPGLFQKIDGTVWLRNPDGSETQVGVGSSIGPVVVSGTPSAGQIIVATAADAADWEDPAAPSVPPVGVLNGSVVLSDGVLILTQIGPLQSSHSAALSIQGPPLLIAAMSAVCSQANVLPRDIPDISDQLDVLAILYVTDQAGANTLKVAKGNTQNTPIVGNGASIDWTGSSATIVGVDLSWDDTTGTVTSAAGGIYSVTLIGTCSPD